ncbi:hypothetical protein ACT89R_01730 [Rhodococcus qingshengii]
MTPSSPATLMGVQTPALRRLPKTVRPGALSHGHRAIKMSELAGRRVIPWQKGALIDIQTIGDDGLWAASEAAIIASRQNGKNGIVESLELDWMTAEPGVRIAHTAHEFKTAMKSLNKLEALVKGLPGAGGDPGPRNSILKAVRRSHGEEGIYFHNGSYCEFSTRTKSAGRGTSYDRLIIDEAMIYTPESQAALEPLVNTAPNGQIIYTGSAPDDSMEYAQAWADLYHRALEDNDEDALCYLGWLCEAGADPDDRSEWAKSNPSIGYLITERTIAARRRSMRSNVSKFLCEYMSVGIWPKPEEGIKAVIDKDQWSSMENLAPDLIGPIAVAVDRSRDGRRWAIAVAQRTTDDRIHLEVGYFRAAPNSDVVAYLVNLIAHWDPCALVIDTKSPAKVLQPLLIAAGIEPIMGTAPNMVAACQGFFDDATDSILSHTNQPAINEALESAAQRFLPGGDWAWTQVGDAVISPLVAATLARWALITFGPLMPKKANTTTTTDVDLESDVDEFDALSVAF